MVYDLQKFLHYFLGLAFKFFIDHSTLKYLVNKSVLGGRIFHWLFLFKNLTLKLLLSWEI
jgi:hypothetical protein